MAYRDGQDVERRILTLLVGVVCLCAAFVIGHPAAAASTPQTIVSFSGFAYELGFEGDRVVWIDKAWILRVRAVSSGTQSAIHYTNFYEEMPDPDFSDRPRLALAGQRLAWLSTRGAGRGFSNDHVYTARIEDTSGRRLFTVQHAEDGEGGYVTGLAGDSLGFSYGLVKVEGDSGQGIYHVAGGGVWTMVGAQRRRLPGVPPGIVLARAAGRIAVAPVVTDERSGASPVATGLVEIRDAENGTLISSFTPGFVRPLLALTAEIAAVRKGSRIDWYDPKSGTLLGSVSLPSKTETPLVASGHLIAVRTAHALKVLDTETRRVSAIPVAAPWHPLRVAISGSTVAWTEVRITADRKGFITRINVVALPG
jgi:hypothetical protein